jgi:hypothetical protein
MAPIDEALEDLKSRKEGEQFSLTEIADKYGVNRSTLGRRWKGVTGSKEEGYASQQALSPQQEIELVQYIERLTKRGLPPTREMIKNFSSEVAKRQLGESWVTRFINRNKIHLISKWTTGIDRNRHQADSETKYRLYFDLLHSKMREYNILPCHTYNMDEKGFLTGVIGRTLRIFSKRMWDKKEVRASLQDGSREFITLLASTCADGSRLPAGLIFASAKGDIRSTWVDEIEVGKHDVFITSSPTGWSNNDIGLAWLEQVFNRSTKRKAGRSYRLLILDGHGSHITMDFIEYCDKRRILLMVFPPHSTHTLQPLDVVMFKPLSQAYTVAHANFLQKAQGLVSIKKGDFFPLFWQAWTSSFTESLILKSFEATGIWPMDPIPVLQKFTHTPSPDRSSPSNLSDNDWIRVERLLRSAVRDVHQEDSKKLSLSLHHLSTENQVLHYENQGLREALQVKKKHKNKGKVLDLQQRQEYHGGGVLYSPKKVREGRMRRRVNERLEAEEKLRKARAKKEREDLKLQRQLEAEERRVERERLKVVREKEKADKAAERQRQKEERDSTRALQLSQKRKRQASRPASSNKKRQRRIGDALQSDQVGGLSSAPPPKITTRGRNVNLPQKFR